MGNENRRSQELFTPSPFKIVALIVSIISALAVCVGGVTWVSINMANNAVGLETLRKEAEQHHDRFRIEIDQNKTLINQHAQLLAILKLHGDKIATFESFMTKGGRFTEQDGQDLREDLETVRERLMHYQVLEAELRWIKKSLVDLSDGLKGDLDRLGSQLEKVAQKQDRVYEMHQGFSQGHE